MSMFNMGAVKGAGIASGTNNYLKAGIHEVVFKGINKVDGSESMELLFETVDGTQTHKERIFAPQSADRGESQFGPTPSQMEQFLSKVKCIIGALDKDLYDKIEKDGEKFNAPDFDGFVNLLKKYLDKKVGSTTYIKLIPTNGNFVGFPGFPARINRDGDLYIANKFIGEGLVLTAQEVKRIEEAANAKPTPMAKKESNSDLDAIMEDFPAVDDDDEDKLPF